MTGKIISFLILFFMLSIYSYSQTYGVTGNTVYPKVVNMSDMPYIGEIQMWPIIESHFNEGEPPDVPVYPIPRAEDLPHFTYDKGAHNNSPLLAPTTGVNFEGVLQTTSIPSEPQPAAGPNHIVVLGNVSIKITDKTGTILQNTLQSTFFGIPAAEGPGFDSKCYYDARHGRFLLLCETQTTTPNPNVCSYYLAISQTNNAMGSWFIYKFDMTKDGAVQSTNWSDFPGLGLSDNKIVMSGQQFSFSGNIYQYQKLRIIDRSTAFSGGAVTATDIFNWSGQLFVTKPGRNISTGDTVHILATRNGGGTSYEYRRLTGTASSPVLSGATLIPVSSYSLPPDAPGGSAAVTVNTGDSRTPDFFVRNGILYLASHVGVTISSTSVSAIKFVKIQVSPLNTTPLTDETFGAASTFYYYPMVCADSVGTVFIGFGKSSSAEFPSSYVTGKRRNDATIQASVLAKAGTIVNVQSRWGDYSGIDMDESASTNGASFAWYSGQWTKSSNVYGTWVTQMSFTYGKISGQVVDDADGDISTAGDRTPFAGATVTLKQGASTIATTSTDVSGNYTFGYLETAANYSVSFAPPGVKHSMDVSPGSGGTSQTKTDYKTIAVNLTNAQSSTGNNYIVSDWLTSIASGNWNVTSTWIDNVTPTTTEKVFVTPATTVTINTDLTCNAINDKGVLQFDNVLTRTCNINSSFIFSNGTVTMGSNVMIFPTAANITGTSATRYFITDGTGYIKRSSLGGAINVQFPIGTATSYNPVTVNNSGTPDDFLARVQTTFSPPPIDPTKVVNRMWIISEAIPGGTNATITLQYNTGEFPGTFINTSGNTVVGRHNGTTWVETPATWANPSAGVFTATASGFTAFSPFAVGNQGALPVELTSFNYQATSARDIKLNWTTSREINNSGFDIEKAVINMKNPNSVINWIKIGTVPGHGTTDEQNNYSYTDSKLNTGTYQYRLKQIDYNGNFEYFGLNTDVTIGTPGKFDVSQSYPNPSNPKSKIDYQIPFSGKVQIKIYDLLGREVATLIDETKEAGYYSAEFDGSNLASGIYIYRIIAKDASSPLSMTKTMKMVLVK